MELTDYTLFLDDERVPGPAFTGKVVIARSFWEFKKVIKEHGIPAHVAFDHDLGDPNPRYNGKLCAEYLVQKFMYHEPDLANFTFSIHSQNPIGAENIRSYLTQYLKSVR